MTPDEQRLLADLAAKIAQTPPPQRDPEAEEFIRRNIGSRPDALYLMTQTVLIQNMALQQAQQQIHDLQQRQAAQPGYGAPAAGSFLGGGYQSQQAPPPQYAPPAPQAAPSFMQGSGGGFLKGAAQTAAGVAAGALAFEGIRSLFEHPGFGGGFGGGGGFGQTGFMGNAPVEETVVNNYYDSPAAGAGNDAGNDARDADYDNSQQDDDTQVQDADYDDSNSGDDSSGFDDIA